MTHLSGFYLPWFAALAVAGAQPPASTPTIVHFQGLDVPIVQAVLAVTGVLMARPLARKKESTLPLRQFLTVTAIMLVAALAWVIETRPTILFAFVVAIGLGFSGYALVETVSDEIQDIVKRLFAAATSVLGNIGVPK
jgi:uncharacterized membrane protein YoaK (UPF0700 family)